MRKHRVLSKNVSDKRCWVHSVHLIVTLTFISRTILREVQVGILEFSNGTPLYAPRKCKDGESLRPDMISTMSSRSRLFYYAVHRSHLFLVKITFIRSTIICLFLCRIRIHGPNMLVLHKKCTFGQNIHLQIETRSCSFVIVRLFLPKIGRLASKVMVVFF